MKRFKHFARGVVAACIMEGAALAGNPPLDRPTPPPCCADGICYPNPMTWGVYPTRWRRWPTEDLRPTPAPPTPAQKLGPDVQPYETPSAEEEDRRAPPPTKKVEEREEGVEAPVAPVAPAPRGAQPPSTAPPSERPSVAPGASPLAPPSPPPTKLPWENGEPTGDWDPPPAPPTTTAATFDQRPATPRRVDSLPAHVTPVRRPAVPASDPPPMLPVSLASASY